MPFLMLVSPSQHGPDNRLSCVQEVLGRYAAPILADYVATAGLSAQAQVGLRQGTETLQDSSLGSSAADALRQGACALYGICSASQVSLVFLCYDPGVALFGSSYSGL